MARGENQKLKLLFLRDLLLETDAEHPITMDELLEGLKKRGVAAERKSIYSDIEALRSYGMDIVLLKQGRAASYFVNAREFEAAELKLLVDSVQAAKFLSEKKSLGLIKKLAALSSRHERALLNRQLYVMDRGKSQNEQIYYSVDAIHAAIASDRQIGFRYWQYSVEKEQVFRHGGKAYRVSPYALIWDDENYYLIAYDAESGLCKHFRVDKMASIRVQNEQRVGKESFGRIDMAAYQKRTFSMFAGEEQTVTLCCDNAMIGVIVDRFGRSVPIARCDDGHFITHVRVAVSPQFFGWLGSLEGQVVVSAPDRVQKRYTDYLKTLLTEQEREAEKE